MNDSIEKRLAKFGQRALSTPATVRNSFLLAEKCIQENVEGDFVECGVFCGTQIAAMALASQIHAAKRRVHLFDSFEGIPQAGINDGADIRACIGDGNGELKTTGISASSVEAVQKHMREWGVDTEDLIYHKGWFQTTVPNHCLNIEKIALLRLDGDLYESTIVCLEYLHPLVSQGGYVIVDDYALTGCRKACDEYFNLIGFQPDIHPIVDGGGPVFYQV